MSNSLQKGNFGAQAREGPFFLRDSSIIENIFLKGRIIIIQLNIKHNFLTTKNHGLLAKTTVKGSIRD